jgi:hypothetical protein
VVGPPRPDVVEDHVVAVDLERDRGGPGVGPADPEEDVLQRGRVRRVAGLAVLAGPAAAGADAQQSRGTRRSGVDHDPRDVHARNVADLQRDRASGRRERGKAQPEDDRMRALDVQGPVHRVDAGEEEQVAALGQGRVDLDERRVR